MVIQALDLFSGPRGWDVHDAELGIHTVGVEHDAAARATAAAAGFWHVHDDVRTYHLPATGYTGLKASPPCPTFSAAGNGHGRANMDIVHRELKELVRTGVIDYRHFSDIRTGLVLEPLRVILEADRIGHPFSWIVLEQVPGALPVWEEYAPVLEELGYNVATGNMHAEQYGVPQTRKRAILIAQTSLCPASLPTPTHSRFHSRAPERLDAGVLPWVSMAQALGWGLSGRPSPTVTGGGTHTGGAEPLSHLSRWSERTDWVQRSNYSRGNSGGTAAERGRTERTLDQPSTTVTGKGFQWAPPSHMGDVKSDHGTVRQTDQPAPTLTSSMDNGNFQFVYRNGNQAHSAKRTPDQVEWMDPELAPDPAASGERVTVQEAAILQTFPWNYPWQGTKSQQYQQVGNAIPPLLAKAILREVL